MKVVTFEKDVNGDPVKNDVPMPISKRKLIVALVGVLCLTILIATTIAVAVRLGAGSHEEHFQKFIKEGHTKTEEVYKREYKVSQDELIFSYNDGIAVFDRKRGLLIYKRTTWTSKCYIAPYNITDLPDASNILNFLDKTDSFKTEVNQLIDYKLHPTGVSLADRTTISKAASKTCEGTDTEWAYLSKQTGIRRTRRTAPIDVDIKITKERCTINCRVKVGPVDIKIDLDIPFKKKKPDPKPLPKTGEKKPAEKKANRDKPSKKKSSKDKSSRRSSRRDRGRGRGRDIK